MKLEKQLKGAMVDYGAVNENWRIKIVAIEKIADNSDFANVTVEIYKPRSRQPAYLHTLYINMVKEFVCWDRSTHVNLK